MDRIFGSWFNFAGFDAWKLNTLWDYAFFVLTIGVGVLLVFLAIRYLNRHRNHDDAVKRTAKRLKKLGGKGAECYIDKTVHRKKDSCHCDLIYAACDKIYLVQVYHFGLQIIGGAGEPTWEFYYNKTKLTNANPLPLLKEEEVILTRVFSAAGVRNVPIEPLIVFADNYGTAKFKLPGVRCAVSIGFLRRWRKDRPLGKKPDYDLEAAKAALEASFAANANG